MSDAIVSDAPVDVAILRFPGISEHQELDALLADPAARARFVGASTELGRPELIVLPGSETTLADLAWMRATGLFDAVLSAHARGAVLVGICGGFQIMGTLLRDPLLLEGGEAESTGLGVLPVETTFARDPVEEPTLGTSTGELLPRGAVVAGREIHGGRSVLTGDAVAIFGEPTKGGGACPLGVATAGLGAIGTYLHDVFADAAFRAEILARVRARRRPAG